MRRHVNGCAPSAPTLRSHLKCNTLHSTFRLMATRERASAIVKCARNQPARAAYNLCNAQMHNPQDRDVFWACCFKAAASAHIQHVLRVCVCVCVWSSGPFDDIVFHPLNVSVDNATSSSSPALLLYNGYSNWNFGGQQRQRNMLYT